MQEENKILTAISEKAQEAGIISFEKLVDFAVNRGIFQTPLAKNLAKKVLATNKDIYGRLMRALEPTKKEELDKILKTFKKAGISTWKEITFFACVASIKGYKLGVRLEDLQGILIKDPEAVNKIVEAAEIEGNYAK